MSLVIHSREVDSAAAVAMGFVAGPFYGSHGTGEEVDGSAGGRGSGGGYGSDAENGGGPSESSSIGVAGESSISLSEGEEGEEVESKMRDDPYGSMDSLDEALPVKRGLSNFFSGKSKSFTALSDVVTQPMTAGDLAKPENPFNKKRRILMARRSRWPRRASCSSLDTSAAITLTLDSANLFSLQEDEEEEDQEEKSRSPSSPSSSRSPCPSPSALGDLPSFCERRFHDASNDNFSFRSTRSLSLGDLQHHADLSSPE